MFKEAPNNICNAEFCNEKDKFSGYKRKRNCGKLFSEHMEIQLSFSEYSYQPLPRQNDVPRLTTLVTPQLYFIKKIFLRMCNILERKVSKSFVRCNFLIYCKLFSCDRKKNISSYRIILKTNFSFIVHSQENHLMKKNVG